ncbi:MAG TPA: SIMPL domain-containing protein, partial [Chitinophagaceae bacterium]|nr:SIMPL domain-containing protein [Chitinophagaceae bacterium]
MKQLLFLLACVCILHTSKGQAQVPNPNPFPRTVNVSGSAEMEVIPDEIYVQVDLREYDRKNSPKVSIDEIKNAFLSNVRQIGIPDSAVSIASYEGYSGYQWWK